MEKLKRVYKRIDKIPTKNGIGFVEIFFFIVIAVVCYIFFSYQDILITAGHAIEYLNGHITDFYSACHKSDGTYGANYLPTTFIVFAIWNIPMKLLGLAPKYFGDWSVPFIMYNKLLPTIIYFVSGWLLYKIVRERFGFERNKAMLTVFLMFTTPMAFFSQFFFCQYDIFTVLFMLAGMYYFFKEEPTKKDIFLFSLFFGIATTFKYFALVIFVVMLLLRQKNVWKIMLSAIPAAVPLVLEVGFYGLFDRRAFIKSVFQFNALDKANGFSINIGGVEINIIYVVMLAIIALSYFTKIKSFDELVGYSMYYSCGVCFAIFGMMLWYPQWLLFMAPFWVLSTVINKNYKIFFCIDTLLGVVLDMFIVNEYRNGIDQGLFRFGIFHEMLKYKQHSDLKMRDIFVYQDKNTLFTIIAAIFLIGFIFKNPKFNFDKIKTSIADGRFIINVRFLAFSMAFIVAAFACLPSFMARQDVVWRRYGGLDQKIVTINNKNYAEEYTELKCECVKTVYVVTDSVKAEGKKALIYVEVFDTETGEKVAEGHGREKNIHDGSRDPKRIILDKPFYPKKNTLYKFRFSTDSSRKVAIYFEKNAKETASFYKIYQKDYSSCYSTYKGKKMKDRELVMYLTGDYKE